MTKWALALAASGLACSRTQQPQGAVHPAPPPPALPDAVPVDGVTLPITGGFLRIEACSEDIVRVAMAPDPKFFVRSTLATLGKRCAKTRFNVIDRRGGKTIDVGALSVDVALPSGTVSFSEANAPIGTPPILTERAGGRILAHGIPVWAVQALLPLGFCFIAMRLLLRSARDPQGQVYAILAAAEASQDATHQ